MYEIHAFIKGKWSVYPKKFESFEDAFLIVEEVKDKRGGTWAIVPERSTHDETKEGE